MILFVSFFFCHLVSNIFSIPLYFNFCNYFLIHIPTVNCHCLKPLFSFSVLLITFPFIRCFLSRHSLSLWSSFPLITLVPRHSSDTWPPHRPDPPHLSFLTFLTPQYFLPDSDLPYSSLLILFIDLDLPHSSLLLTLLVDSGPLYLLFF